MTKVIRLAFFIFILSSVGTIYAQCNQTASSSTEAAMQAAINKASAGQTACMPTTPGSVTWGTNSSSDVTLNVPAGITVNFEGWNITDNLFKGGSSCSGGAPLVTLNTSSGNVTRATNLTITAQAISANCGESEEHVLATGKEAGYFRVDHVTFNGVAQSGSSYDQVGVNTSDAFGVVDHNTFNNPGDVFPTAIHNDAYLGAGWYGDNSWTQPDTFGSENAVYMENNTYSYTVNGPFPTGCFDAEEGGRLVFRFNTGCPFVGAHGLDSSGRYRSVRQWEIYDNTFVPQPNAYGNMYTGIFLRGGTGFVFSNTFTDTGTGTPYITLAQLNSYRDTSGYAPWGSGGSSSVAGTAEGCDGRGGFDTNTNIDYASFTASGSSTLDSISASGVLTLINGLLTLGVNQLADVFTTGSTVYSLVDTTANWGSTIQSNTANSFATSVAAQPGAGLAHTASSGDAMQVLSAYPCLDQVGRGAGTLIQDSSNGNGIPVLASTGKPGADNQASDPAYEWLDNQDGTTKPGFTVGGTGYFHIQPNRDYFAWTSSFNGTSGVGSGVLASRPATCTTGVGYWATDQGNWNQSGSGGQGELFVCTATNVWTLNYTPYTYPHPIEAQGTTSQQPSAPVNLTATPVPE